MIAPIRPSPLQRGRGSSPEASGERGLQGIEDAGQHSLFVVENVIVPEAEDAKALSLQIGVTLRIAFALAVLPPIRFDDQPSRRAGKIDDVAVNRQLALELVAGETLCAQDLPESVLGRRWLCPHLLGTFAHDLLPAPLPASATLRLSLPRRGGRGWVRVSIPSPLQRGTVDSRGARTGSGARHWRSP